jgi:hypothetical protein
MPYGRPSRLVYSQIPRGVHPGNRTTLSSYRFRIAVALTVTVIYTAYLYRLGAFRGDSRQMFSGDLSRLLHSLTWLS